MLAIYADALRTMQAMGPDNPLSWMWQWYTHFVDGATTKANEISAHLRRTVAPQRTLAEEIWNTCQSHAGQNSNHFLPWHRYLRLDARTHRPHRSAAPDFTMPYWDYTSTDPAKRGVVPDSSACRTTRCSACCIARTAALANSGQPIHEPARRRHEHRRRHAKTELQHRRYVQGFCRTIDSGIHGRIHVLTGTSTAWARAVCRQRSAVLGAPRNIDRMWASWNRNGNKNPTDAVATRGSTTPSRWPTNAACARRAASEPLQRAAAGLRLRRASSRARPRCADHDADGRPRREGRLRRAARSPRPLTRRTWARRRRR